MIRQNCKALLNHLFALLVLGSCVFTLMMCFGENNWLLDITSHFPLQYLVIQVIGLIVVLKNRPKVYLAWSLALLVLISVNVWQVYSYYWPTPQEQQQKNVGHIKILHMNVLFLNQNYKIVRNILKSTDADIVSLQEINEEWFSELKKEESLEKFPYRLTHVASGNVLLSRFKLINPKIVSIKESREETFNGKKRRIILFANISLNGELITLINMHPPVPLAPQYADKYMRYFEELEGYKKNFSENSILFGDLNTTPWSRHYRWYLNNLNLKDARAHQGFYPTWNCFLPMFFIPIDHVLVTKNFVTLKQQTGPFIGSDHLPVYIELGLKP